MRTLIASLGVAVLGVASVSAAPSLIVENKTHDSPMTAVDGFFDVYFQVPSGETLAPMAGYQIKLDLSPAASGVQFLSIENTASPRSPVFPTTPPIDFGVSASMIMAGADMPYGKSEQIDDGEGLLRVWYRIEPGTIGSFSVTLDVGQTFLSDALAAPIEYQKADGIINVVPEPMAMGTLAGGSLMLLVRKRHRAAVR